MKKKLLLLVLMVMLSFLLMTAPAMATDIKIVIDGKTLSSDVAPQIVNSRTLVPLRVISESLGAKVDYKSQRVYVETPYEYGSFMLKLNNQNVFYYFPKWSGWGEEIDYSRKIDVKPYVKNNRVLVPLRFVAEQLKCDVDYKRGVVTIHSVEKGSITLSQAKVLAVENFLLNTELNEQTIEELVALGWDRTKATNTIEDTLIGIQNGTLVELVDENDDAYLIGLPVVVAEAMYRVDKNTGEVKKMAELEAFYTPGKIKF